MSKQLEEIRKNIDSLDDCIHDLLMERADLIAGVTAEKKKTNSPVMRPAREAKMLRRLLARHKGPLPEAAIIGIWRELVGGVYLLQAGLSVAVSAQKDEEYCWDAAKNYFGSILPMKRVDSSSSAIAAVEKESASFAVVPWPAEGQGGGEGRSWWMSLLNQEEGAPVDGRKNSYKMRIVCALPYGSEVSDLARLEDKSLIVARTEYAPSGDDYSFVALCLPEAEAVSRARILELFQAQGLEPRAMIQAAQNFGGAQEGTQTYLVEVPQYVGEADERLLKIEQSFDEGQAVCCSVLGGYPVPPVLKAVPNV